MTDTEVKLTVYFSEKKYPESLRLVRYYDDECKTAFCIRYCQSFFIKKDG